MNLNVEESGPVGPGGNPGNTKRISASKRWCFTLNSYIERDINDILTLGAMVLRYVFQEEIGENGNQHLQGYIEFKNRVRPKNLLRANHHWEKCKNKPASITYCSDPSKRMNGGRVWVKGIHLPEQVKVIKESDLYPWQKEIIEITAKTGDDRSIYWIHEKVGNVGKSALVKYLCVKHNAIVLSGKGADMKYGIIKFFEKNETYPSLILLDIPRSVKDYISWCGIEEVKNGCFFSSKYECGMAVFNSPVIICFANFEPPMGKLSVDRWKLGEVIGKEWPLSWRDGKVVSLPEFSWP